MLDDKCGYLKVTAETMGSSFQDYAGYLTGNQKYARDMFREKLNDLRTQGMEYLVIDLRNNEGGFDEIAIALCDLLTDKDWYGQGLGIRKDGKYTSHTAPRSHPIYPHHRRRSCQTRSDTDNHPDGRQHHHRTAGG